MNYNFYDKYYRSVKIFNIYILYLLCFGPLYCKDIFYRDACVPSWQNWQMDSTSCTWCTCSLPYSAHILLLHYTPLYTALKLINILYLSILLYIPSFTYLSSTILNNILYLFSPILHYTPLNMVVMFHNVLCMSSTIFHFMQYLFSSIYCTHAQLYTVPVLQYTTLYSVTTVLLTIYCTWVSFYTEPVLHCNPLHSTIYCNCALLHWVYTIWFCICDTW